MSMPVHITFRRLTPRDDLEAEIRSRAAQLATYFDRIIDCHVVVELPHRRHHVGNQFRVCVELSVPNDRLVSVHDSSPQPTRPDGDGVGSTKQAVSADDHANAWDAIRDAFDRSRRQLQDYVGRQRQTTRVSIVEGG